MSEILALACAYHGQGFNVLPLKRDKRPVVEEWGTLQTHRQTVEDLTALPWQRVNTAGVGAVVGAVSGDLVCIDADRAPGRHVLDSILGRLGLPRDYAWAVHTPGKGGGWHVWVRCPGLAEKGLPSGAPEADFSGADHIELRWDEHYTVLPGSAHPEGGSYDWANGNGTAMPAEPPAVVPADKLLHLAKWKRTTEEGRPAPAASLPDVIHEGQGRNNAMTSLAGTMRRRGTSPEGILAALRVENERICRPPLSERELQSIGKKEPVAPAAAESPTPEGYSLTPLDWLALIRDGVPEVEYIEAPYFPKMARIWVVGATGTFKSLYCQWIAARLSQRGVRVSYFSEENPLQEELRRLSKLRPDPDYFHLFHRTGLDLLIPEWVQAMLEATRGDAITFFDSWTDLWSGDENDNRAVQQFDALVLKRLQAQGTTPVVLHHTGHRYMFSDRKGATAARGASSLGQKADVMLEFKSGDDDTFTIVYGKCRIGGVRHPDRTFKALDQDDGSVGIVDAGSPEKRAVDELTERMVQAILTAPRGYVTTNELRVVVGGNKNHQTEALHRLESDYRVRGGAEKVQTQDGKRRDAKVWRGAGVLGDKLPLEPVGEPSSSTHPPYKGGDRLPTSALIPTNLSPGAGEYFGSTSTAGQNKVVG